MLKNMLLLLVGQFKMVLLLPINSCGEPPITHFLILVPLDMTVTNQSRVLWKIQLIQESFVFGV